MHYRQVVKAKTELAHQICSTIFTMAKLVGAVRHQIQFLMLITIAATVQNSACASRVPPGIIGSELSDGRSLLHFS